MTLLGVRLRDLPSTYGWDALPVLARHLPMGSATVRHLRPDEASFSSEIKRAALLAAIFDAIEQVAYIFAAAHSKRQPKQPKPYPRPWVVDEKAETFGSAPIKVSDFDDWYNGT